jgi:5-methylcytosine-specific restriction endonuclease McrA
VNHATRNPSWPTISREARERSGGICAHCLQRFPTFALHVDHIVRPELWLIGDPDAATNLQVLCATCHGRKTANEQPLYASQHVIPLRDALASTQPRYAGQPETSLKDTLVGSFLRTSRDRTIRSMIDYGSSQRGLYRG